MRVFYKGFLSSLTGVPEEEVELEAGATVGQMLEELAARHGEPFRKAVMPGGSRGLVALLSVDGAAAGLSDVLREGARVLIVRAVGGG